MAEPIIINQWNTGMAKSPHIGFAELRNVITGEESGQDGVLEVGWASESIRTLGDVPKWTVQNKSVAITNANHFFAFDSSNNLYNNAGTAASVALGGLGAIIWKDHILGFSNTSINVYRNIIGATAFTSGWQTIDSDDEWHPVIVGQDDIVYFGAGRFVGSVQEASGQNFQDGTAATYVFNSQALDLKEDYRIRTIGELGKELVLGTWTNSGNVADLIFWDRSSDTFRLPIQVPENGVKAGITVGNLYYFFAGNKGKCYVTNGVTVDVAFQLPIYLVNPNGLYNDLEVYPWAIAFHERKIKFGLFSSTAGNDYNQIWSYNVDTRELKIENEISTGFTKGSKITSMFVRSETEYRYLLQDSDNAFRLDRVISEPANGIRYTSYAARVDSQYYSVGQQDNPRVFSELEFELAKPLSTAQGLRFAYRTDLNSGFTETSPYTFDFTTHGNIQGGLASLQTETKQGIQFRIEMTTGSGTASTPQLKSVTVR